MKFKLKKQVVAGIMAAALLTASVPAVNVSAAKIKYTGTYTKEIEIEKVEKQESSSSNSSSSSTGTNDNAVLMTLATNDNASVIDNTNNSQTGASDNSQTGASNNGSDTAQVDPATVPEPEVQDETVRVMPGMKFVIDATRYGKKVKIEKNKDTFKYKSSNKKIATVSKKGVVTTLKEGKCDITITDKKDGTPFVLHLNVKKTVKVKKVTLDKKSKTYKNLKKFNKSFQLNATIKPEKYDNVPILWGSTNSSVATVDQRGLVKIVGYGECEIYCKAGSTNATGKCTVKVPDPNAKKNENNNNYNSNVSYNKLAYNTGKLVDISSHNTVSSWDQLKNSCDGVLIRCGYRGYSAGTLQEDIKFRSNVYNCQQHGIPFSVYYFTTATNEQEGIEEANWIANAIAGMNISIPVFIDSEYSNLSHNGRSDGLSKAQRTAAVRAACAQLNARGIPSGVYASTYWLRDNLDMSQLPFYVWVADYRGYCGYSGNKFAWQYTSNGQGYGVANRCDVSYWYN